jgi:hypothetical protein
MNATEFAYWLQGYFEIKEAADTDGRLNADTIGTLSRSQAQAVLKMAESVKPGTSSIETQAQNFVMYAQGALSTIKFQTPTLEFLVATTLNLKSRLNDLFLHAIDPALPGDQTVHREAHRPGKPAGERPLC